MVETERTHRSSRASSTGDFFFCFSSRSSMKMSSRSMQSPGRGREPNNTLSLSSSFSRRLRSNGSMKGGQSSPMFSTGSKKKGGSFESPEPFSPKVTCIGQVRVKSKKKHRRKLRARSARREVSFRKTEQTQDGIGHLQQQQQTQQECLRHRNQRWVHLPLSICETLRGFGVEFNCFTPCGGRRSSKVEKRRRGSGSSSCGAVFARWLFALQESEEKERKIDSFVSEEENRGNRVDREVVVEILEEKLGTKEEIEDEVEEVEEGRKSICIPPKNALLLMRSRSAPFRISSLGNKFWVSPAPQNREDEEEVGELDDEKDDGEDVENECIVAEEDLEQDKVEENGEKRLKEEENEETPMKEDPEGVVEVMVNEVLMEALKGEEKLEVGETELDLVEDMKEVKDKKDERRVSFSSSTMYLEPESELETEAKSDEEEVESALLDTEEASVSVSDKENDDENVNEKEISPRSTTNVDQEQINDNKVDHKDDGEEEEEEEEKSLLPDCLLLMMCEPKSSMEVSKETWVCSTSLVRFWHSEKKVVQKNVGDELTKKRLSTDSNPNPVQPVQQPRQQVPKKQLKQHEVQVQPARSSCSKVEQVAQSMATVIEQKLKNGEAYDPFVLKRCKSEPMRNSDKLAPDVCFWKKNKIEVPHRAPLLAIGAAGIDF